ncbi:hypothetical protein OKW39_002783 [Paraburkholderia sp. MM6662-R1]
MMRPLKRWSVAKMGVGREVRVVSGRCFGLYVAATLGAGVAQAATPLLLPPLPTYAALDDPAVSANTAYETAPLPSGGIGQAANPFGDVSTPGAAQEPDTLQPAARSAIAPDASPDDLANGPMPPPSPQHNPPPRLATTVPARLVSKARRSRCRRGRASPTHRPVRTRAFPRATSRSR